MTQNEVDIIKNAVLDATEAYVDARLNTASFVKTQIGVVQGEPTKDSSGKYRHTVVCNATDTQAGITYNNVLSVGNLEFPDKSVVFLIAPNAQFSNQFILGKLDSTPCNITGGSININDKFIVDKDGNVICKNIDAQGGKIGGFTISTNALQRGDNSWYGEFRAGCGHAGRGIINLVGGTDSSSYGYIQISVSGDPYTCLEGIRIYYDGRVVGYDGNGDVTFSKNLSNI